MSEKRAPKRKLAIMVVGVWVGVALGVFALFFVFDLGEIFSGAGDSSIARKGEMAPDFGLQNLAGEQVHLSDHSGKVVVLNFWATWCGPCVREMPMFQQYHDIYTPGLVVLGVNKEEKADDVGQFISENGLTYEILLDLNAHVSDLYDVFGLPVTIFIDQEGVLRFYHIGIMTEEQFSRYLQALGVMQ